MKKMTPPPSTVVMSSPRYLVVANMYVEQSPCTFLASLHMARLLSRGNCRGLFRSFDNDNTIVMPELALGANMKCQTTLLSCQS
jgi:hypothetical protein